MSAENLTFVQRCAAIGAGETLEFRRHPWDGSTPEWREWLKNNGSPGLMSDRHRWRIKPPEKKYIERLIRYPAPETFEPPECTEYYTLEPFTKHGLESYRWSDMHTDFLALKNGAVWLSESDAKEAAAAIFDITSEPKE
jgi:hypothetical protein